MSIREKIQSNLILKKNLRNHKKASNNKAFLSLKEAAKIGILIDLRDQKNQNPSIDFFKKIKRDGCSYKVLLFISEKRADINLYNYERLFPGAQVHVVCPEDHSYWNVPKKDVIFQFLGEAFDILFRLCLDPIFDLDIVLLKSRAKMYAGQSHIDLSFLDFTIDAPKGSDLRVLTDNLMVYLEKLDPEKNKSTEFQQNKLF